MRTHDCYGQLPASTATLVSDDICWASCLIGWRWGPRARIAEIAPFPMTHFKLIACAMWVRSIWRKTKPVTSRSNVLYDKEPLPRSPTWSHSLTFLFVCFLLFFLCTGLCAGFVDHQRNLTLVFHPLLNFNGVSHITMNMFYTRYG